MNINLTLNKILSSIESNGGEIFVVGGSIRDRVLGIHPKDIDFLVRKLTLAQISNIIKNIGIAGEVGQSFGIVKGVVDGQEFDFAIPRTSEIKNGNGHADFNVQIDPNASVESDLSRRDFTFNAMAIPLKDFISNDLSKVIDPHNGMGDLKIGVVKTVGDPNSRFIEDPLRIMRSIMFATRMGFVIETDTFEAIRKLAPMLKTVSGERILEEFKKAWTKGKADSEVFITLLELTGVGKLLFGEDFDPMPVMLDFGMPLKDSEDVVAARMVAFFLKGGDVTIMKPDAIHIKFLEVAKKTFFTDDAPFTFIGNMKPLLPILFVVALELDETIAEKVRKMMDTPLVAKELDIKGEDIISIMQIASPKDNKKIGIVQKSMLESIWEGRLHNEHSQLVKFCQDFKNA